MVVFVFSVFYFVMKIGVALKSLDVTTPLIMFKWILDVKAFPLDVRWSNGHNEAYVLAF